MTNPKSVDPELRPLTPDDAGSILMHYSLGDLVSFVELPFRAHNAPYYRVETTRGRYFLKRFKRFDANVDRGLDLIVHLRRHGYPAIDVQVSRSGSPHGSHDGVEVALFEYLDAPEDWTLNRVRAAALGDALGRFHALADGFALPDTFLGHGQFSRRLRDIPARRWMPPEAQETVEWMRESFPRFGAAPDQPRGACHVEFVLEHVRFAGDTLLRVFDWDIVGADYLYHDLGTTLSAAVHEDGIDFTSLAAVVRAYDDHRPLTEWERSHLFEATCFGACKFLIWELEPRYMDDDDPPYDTIRKVGLLRVLGKAEFDERLGQARTAS